MSIHSALKGVREEVETIILGLTPNRMVKQRATFKLYKAEQKKPITEMTGSSRLFFVGYPEPSNTPWHVGYTTHAETYTSPITVVYAAGQAWREAGHDDMHQIKNTLLITPSTVSGVAHRSVFPGQQNETILTSDNGEWEYWTLLLTIYLSVTP